MNLTEDPMILLFVVVLVITLVVILILIIVKCVEPDGHRRPSRCDNCLKSYVLLDLPADRAVSTLEWQHNRLLEGLIERNEPMLPFLQAAIGSALDHAQHCSGGIQEPLWWIECMTPENMRKFAELFLDIQHEWTRNFNAQANAREDRWFARIMDQRRHDAPEYLAHHDYYDGGEQLREIAQYLKHRG